MGFWCQQNRCVKNTDVVVVRVKKKPIPDLGVSEGSRCFLGLTLCSRGLVCRFDEAGVSYCVRGISSIAGLPFLGRFSETIYKQIQWLKKRLASGKLHPQIALLYTAALKIMKE